MLSWAKEAKALLGFGLRDGMEVLEPGSGPGFVTEQLLRLLPNARVTCVEVDPMLGARAKDYLAGQGLTRFQVTEGDVSRLSFPADAFDFAMARFLFQHLRDPVGVAREIRRVLRPGGKFVITDVDDAVAGLMEPDIPERAMLFERMAKAQAARGGNRYVGRRLWAILEEAGYQDLDLELVLAHSNVSGLEPFLPMIDPDRLIPLVKAGALTEAEAGRMRASRERFVADPRASIYLITWMACGTKPGP